MRIVLQTSLVAASVCDVDDTRDMLGWEQKEKLSFLVRQKYVTTCFPGILNPGINE